MLIQRRECLPLISQPKNLALTACLLSLALFGCSGGGSSSEQEAQDPTDADDPAVDTSLVTLSTENIQRSAARRVSDGMGVNLESLQRLTLNAMDDLDPGSLGAEFATDVDLELLAAFDSDNTNFMNNTLGFDGSNARVMREGNVVTVDPDEQLVCADAVPLLNLIGDNSALCEQLLQDMSVQIHAHTDESGLITYSFQNTDVLSIGYSETSASYELQLSGMQQLAERAQQLSGTVVSYQGAMSGALRLSSTVLNDVEGSVAGELMLEVTQALKLVPADSISESFDLQPSTVFQININESTGDVITRVDWGALQLMADISDAGDDTMLAQLNLGGLSASATLNTNTSTIVLSNLGLGDIPLTINVNQVNAVNLNLSTLGVSLDAESGMVTFDGALGAALTVSNIMGAIDGFGPEASLNMSISAAAGTSLRDEGQGSTRVLNNGPFAVSVGVVSNGVSVQQRASFNAGECFASDEGADAGLGLDLIAVPCTQ